MKKTYIIPEAEVIILKTSQVLLTNSITDIGGLDGLGGGGGDPIGDPIDPGTPTEADGREFYWDNEDIDD